MLNYDKYKIGLWTKDSVWNLIDNDDLVEFEFKPNWYDNKNRYKGINNFLNLFGYVKYLLNKTKNNLEYLNVWYFALALVLEKLDYVEKKILRTENRTIRMKFYKLWTMGFEEQVKEFLKIMWLYIKEEDYDIVLSFCESVYCKSANAITWAYDMIKKIEAKEVNEVWI